MESRQVLGGASVQAIVAATDVEKTAEISHSEHATPADGALPYSKKFSTNLTPKQQYQQVWENLKKDKHFVLWALYVVSFIFRWGYDVGLPGTAVAVPGEFKLSTLR
ncbi:hypothetical protein BDZ45DRAFT_693134 [Acephala macrosclerotiorum]|nr:hypothetical protein BDZ45DRAFT_693134 [Acephala macrosclerotiorum]